MVFLNNVPHGNVDPYRHCASVESFNIDGDLDIETIRSTLNKILIYSYEDRQSLEDGNADFINSVFDEEFEKNRAKFLGESEHFFNLLIIRDPFNTIASRLMLLRKHPAGLGGLTNLNLIIENWKIVARKAISVQRGQSEGITLVKYNQWLCDEEYKRILSEKLMGIYWATSVNNIVGYGGGSSFDNTNRITSKLRARDLFSRFYKIFSIKRIRRIRWYIERFFISDNCSADFLERWRLFVNEDEFLELFKDGEIFDLSDAIFGEIPDTRELLMMQGFKKFNHNRSTQ
ncbi:MAG: hypothetical protein SynsKO_45260 [Synoicihabitans sp.]